MQLTKFHQSKGEPRLRRTFSTGSPLNLLFTFPIASLKLVCSFYSAWLMADNIMLSSNLARAQVSHFDLYLWPELWSCGLPGGLFANQAIKCLNKRVKMRMSGALRSRLQHTHTSQQNSRSLASVSGGGVVANNFIISYLLYAGQRARTEPLAAVTLAPR